MYMTSGRGRCVVQRAQSLRRQGQPASEAGQEPSYAGDVEVDVVREVGANAGVAPHQGAAEGGPANANHHGDEAQQQQDEAGIAADFI